MNRTSPAPPDDLCILESDGDVVAARRLLAARQSETLRSAGWDQQRIADRLGEEVIGQPAAIARVSASLHVALSGLSIDVQRPQGFFMFVGPTGCGKTELARALRHVTDGVEPRHLIHYDMSELGDETARSRLIGSNRGFVGYDDTSALLTTQVRANPRSVVVFDEFEKAHPAVHDLMLQVAGRGVLTDGQGRQTRFHNTILVCTSNLGAVDASRTVGFSGHSADPAGAYLDALRRALRPELLGRFHAIVPFRQLDAVGLESVARHHVTRWAGRLADRGWDLTISDEVIDAIVARVDSRYGARDLLTAAEAVLVPGLVGLPPGAFAADLAEDATCAVWR